MKIVPYDQRVAGSVEFTNVGLQLVHNFTHNVYFKVTIFLDFKYLKNGTRQSYAYNGSLIRNRMVYRMVPFSITLNDPQPRF